MLLLEARLAISPSGSCSQHSARLPSSPPSLPTPPRWPFPRSYEITVARIRACSSTGPSLGHDYFDRRDTGQLQHRLISRLEALGLRVTVQPLPQAA